MCSTSFAGANRAGSRVCGIALSAPLFGSLRLIRGAPLSYGRYLSKDSALVHRIGVVWRALGGIVEPPAWLQQRTCGWSY